MSIHSMCDPCYAPYIMAEQKLVPAVLHRMPGHDHAYDGHVSGNPDISRPGRACQRAACSCFSERMRVVHVVVWQ